MTPPREVLPSLRSELVQGLALIGSVWLFAVFLTMAIGIRHEVDDLMDDALQEAAEVLYGTLVLHGPELHLATGGTLPAPPHEERLVWQIVDPTHRVLLRSHKAPGTPLLPVFVAGLSDGPDHWRVYAIRLPDAQRALLVGQPGIERLESRYETIAIVGVSGVAVGLLCAFWMRRRIVSVMGQLQNLSGNIKDYDPMRPDTDLPAPERQEFVDVHAAVMDLGRRLAQRVENEQAFAAHAAHALRTPLAGMDAQLAMAMKEASANGRPRLERTREAVERLKRVITALLALFRSNAALEVQAIDLTDLLSHIPVAGLTIHIDQDRTLTCDPNLMAAALANLLDNALRHGAHSCWITLRSDPMEHRLTLRDDGPGVDLHKRRELQLGLDQAFDAGFVGLGLKLAALVAKAHNGRLVIDDPAPGTGGFSVTMVLASHRPAPR